MKKCIKKLSSFLFGALVSASSLWGQDIPVGTWRSHFSYRDVEHLTSSGNTLYVAAQNGLYSINTNMEISILGKSQGLSDVTITAITYDDATNMLLIGYESGVIDLIASDITTIRDIQNTDLPGAKTISDLEVSGNFAYAATSFGVIVIDLTRGEIVDNYRSIGEGGEDVTVNELTIIDEVLFAKTDTHFQYGSLNKNLLDFGNWTHIDDTYSENLTVFESAVYAIQNDLSLVKFDVMANDWQLVANSPQSIRDLAVHNETIVLATPHSIYSLESGNLTAIDTYNQLEISTINVFNDQIWLGGDNGLLTPTQELILPSGPYTDQISNIRFTRNQLFAFYGPDPETFNGLSDSLGYSHWDGQNWSYETLSGFYNIIDIAFLGQKTYLASVGQGLYDLSAESRVEEISSEAIIPEIEVYSDLTGIIYGSDTSLFTVDQEGTFQIYSEVAIGTRFPVAIAQSLADVLWITRGSAERGVALNYLPDGNLRILNASDGLPSSNVNAVAIDLDDAAWIGTNDGPGFLSDASFAFQSEQVQSPIFENQLLFDNFNIQAVMIDGGNRVWMSTKEGLFVFDNNLSRLDHHFTTENSPLPSHTIEKMAYNRKNGEVFILTDKGLASFRSSSSRGDGRHSSVKIFPNPVRPGYDGLVAISGLANDAIVKITNADGQLMDEIKANGSTASWDMTTYYGQKAPSGVYVFFSSNQDGTETYIGKLAIIN